MYLVNKTTGDVSREATQQPPFGPGFDESLARKADRLEVWGSSFDDPGDDFCLFKLYWGDQKLGTKRVAGY